MSCKKARRQIATMYSQPIETPHDQIRPLTAELSEIRFVASNDLIERLEKIRGLLAHSPRVTNPLEVVGPAGENTREFCSPSSTRVPSQPLIHALVLQDGYRCSYRDESTGLRCDSKHALQIDHKISWARGGGTELLNLRFLCANHHRRVSFLEFGKLEKPLHDCRSHPALAELTYRRSVYGNPCECSLVSA